MAQRAVLNADIRKNTINRNIYGHFPSIWDAVFTKGSG